MSDIEELLVSNDPMSTPVMALDATPLTTMAQSDARFRRHANQPPQDPISQHVLGEPTEDFARSIDAPVLGGGGGAPLQTRGTQQHLSAIAAAGPKKRRQRAFTGSATRLTTLLENVTYDPQLQHLILLFCVCLLVLIPHAQRVLQSTVPVLRTNNTLMVFINAVAISVGYYYLSSLLE